jgi:CBS domain-containing protein
MDAEEVSSVLVDLGAGQYGIVTDRDLRSQVVAGRVSADEPVTAAMSTPVVGVAADETGADVMLMMLDNDVRHVVVFSPRSEVLGVIVAVDLVAAETRTPFVLRRAIATARNKRELQETVAELRSTVIALWRADISPAQISEVISAVTDALVRRVIELAIETEGPPPADFCWMALGSHGRREPVPSSDVDSGMAWRDAPEDDPLKSGARRALASNQTKNYMSRIASSVSDCIRVLGWSLDAHGVTASGFASSSIEDWRQNIATWLRKPTDNKVLIAISILLDGRIVSGDRGLDVKRILYEAGDREVLEQWMLRLALAAKPPTGFMRNIVVEGSGKRRGTFDIKHGGLLPIVDLARYAALKGGIALNATLPRLRAAADEGIFNQATARVLEEAYELFSALRFEHQVTQLEQGGEPDDHLNPEELDPLTRRYLRDAFREVGAVQRSLGSGLPSRR